MTPRWRDANRAPTGRVTAVEVFFDVVFVFTLTQLTRDPGGGPVGGRRLWWLAPYNLGSALLVLAGGSPAGPPGLLVIIALGESVVAIGMGVDVDHLTAGTIAVTVLALALPGGLWWTYFTDTRAAETALASAEGGPRGPLAIRMGFAHIPLLLGIVIAAAGIHAVVAHPGDPAPWRSALALAGGVAVFLAGIAEARRSLRVAPPWSTLVTAAVALATVPIGALVNAGLHLAVVVAVVAAMLVVDRRSHAAETLTNRQVRHMGTPDARQRALVARERAGGPVVTAAEAIAVTGRSSRRAHEPLRDANTGQE
jgi:low temperature requirement protein LtrA